MANGIPTYLISVRAYDVQARNGKAQIVLRHFGNGHTVRRVLKQRVVVVDVNDVHKERHGGEGIGRVSQGIQFCSLEQRLTS